MRGLFLFVGDGVPDVPNLFIKDLHSKFLFHLIFLFCYDKICFMDKMKIKRIVSALLAATLLFSASACSVRNPLKQTETQSTTSNVVRVTFPEGSTITQIAQKLEENGVCSAAEFISAANDPLNFESFSFEIPNPDERAFLLEGYVFPDTYEFYRNESAVSALKRFLKNSEAKFTDEIRARCAELGYTLDEILTLASIIQEEAGDPNEMYKVSSVLHNRLGSSRFPRLQCDVATFYLRDYVKPHVTEERYNELVELYNTYHCSGLPAGPITNSGIDAVKAALYPAKTNYYYFITDGEGEYHYAETWAEHVENCNAAGI